MREQTNTKRGYRDIFSQKEYLKMIIANVVNRFGDSIDAIAFTWLVYELTGNAAWSALIFGFNKVPTILITPFAGAWVEGVNKKWIMVWTDIIRAICVAFVATGYLLGFLTPWILLAITLLISTVEAFRVPAGTAITPKLLSEDLYEYGISLQTSVTSVVEIIGTVMAGGIIALTGISGAIYLDMGTFVISALIIMLINSREQKKQKEVFKAKEYGRMLLDGAKYVRQSKVFLFFMAVCLLLNALLTPFNSLMAPLCSEVLLANATMLSVISVSGTIGMMLGSVSYPWIRNRLSQRMIFVLPGVGIGLYYIALILCRPLYQNIFFSYGFVAISTGFMGCLAAWLSTFMNVEFIKKVDENYLARSAGILTAVNVASTPVTSFIISILIGLTGTANIFLGAGIIAIIVCVLMSRSSELEEHKDVCRAQEMKCE